MKSAETSAGLSPFAQRVASVTSTNGGRHRVNFYDDEQRLFDAVAEFLHDGLLRNEPAVVIATRPHRDALAARLAALSRASPDVALGSLDWLDADELLSQFMVGNAPDRNRFHNVVGAVVARHRRQGGALRAFGEMVDVLWKHGNPEAALSLEAMWNDLAARHDLKLFCAYALGGFHEGSELRRVCDAHDNVDPIAPGPGYEGTTPKEHLRALTTEIGERKRIEAALRDALRELESNEHALRASRRQLEAITGSLPVLVAYVDADRRYRFANDCYERWFERPLASILGSTLREVLGDGAYARIEPHVNAALKGRTTTYEALVSYPQGERHIHATYVPDVDDGGRVRGFTSLVSDISEKQRLEQSRESALRRTERLMRITAAIADAVSSEEVYAAVVDRVAEALGASSAGLWLVDGEDHLVRLERSLGYADKSRTALTGISPDSPGLFPAIDTIRLGQPIFIDSQEELLKQYPHLAEHATPGRDYRIACLPIVIQGRSSGCLAFTLEDAAVPDAEERQFLMLVARYGSQAIERIRLLDAERRSRTQAEMAAARLAVLSRASRVFADGQTELPTVLQTVVDELVPECADACGIALKTGLGALTVVAFAHRAPTTARELAKLLEGQRFEAGMLARVARSGETLFLPDVDLTELAAQAEPRVRDWVGRVVPRSVCAVPLRASGRVIGVLAAMREQSRPRMLEGDRLLLEELAERAATAYERARLRRENEQARVRAELSYAVADTIIEAERVEDVFDASLDAIEHGLETNRCSILVLDESGVMRFRAWRNLSDEYRAAVEGHSPWRADEKQPEPILVPDVERDPSLQAFLPLFRREGIAALAFIPLVAGGRLVGKFMVYDERPRAFGSAEVDMVRALANHVAAAIARFEAMAELQLTVKFNEMFTAVLGHDLRNPLNAIMAAAQLVLLGTKEEKRVKQLLRIVNSGSRMSRMIDQLLDFTRVRVGQGIPLHTKHVELAAVLKHAIDEIQTAEPSRAVQLACDGDTHGSWDEDRLAQIFSNLVGNAVQHGTGEAPVEVRLSASDDEVVVDIHNQGAIPPELLARLFEPMSGTEQRRAKSQGLGLGLFISEQLVKSHGGTIAVESSEEHGTTFRVRLPRKRAAGEA